MLNEYRTQGDGRWFPESAGELRKLTSGLLAAAEVTVEEGNEIVAAMAPHAGYAYSGAVAAHTYRALQECARAGQCPETVVILGFSHREAFPGVAWLDAKEIRTPVGTLPVDRALLTQLVGMDGGSYTDPEPHFGEHSAENQLPLLQVALPGVPVVLGIMGSHDASFCSGLARDLAEMATNQRLCVIASTDLLHDPDYEKVVDSDRNTLQMMEKLDFEGLNKAWSYKRQVCCGIGPVLTVIRIAMLLGCRRGRCLRYCNSGDIDPSGRGQWVVGYGAVIIERQCL